MKQISSLPLVGAIGSLLVILLFANCQKEDISTQLVNSESSKSLVGSQLIGTAEILSQTRTSNFFEPYNLNLWFNTQPQFLSADDNLFTYSRKTNKLAGRTYLTLQDFRFEIPQTATITNIIVVTRRFKLGRGSIRDCFAHLTAVDLIYGGYVPYGVQMAKPDLWNTTETEVVYSQPGAGNNGLDKMCLCGANQQYQWTPEIINGVGFGVALVTDIPTGGIAVMYYDQVQITVEYSMP